MEEKDLEALEGALARASPGPWEAVLRDHPRGQPSCFYRGIVALVQCDVKSLAVVLGDGNPHETVPEERWEANAAAIAALRNLTPALIEEIRAARAWRKEAEALIHHALRLGAEGKAADCQALLRKAARRNESLRDLASRWPGSVLRDDDR